MSSRVETCPHCGRKASANEEFCTACGAWLYGGPEWPAPPRPVSAPETARETSPDDEPIPLVLPEAPEGRPGGVVLRVVAILAALIGAMAWIYAEMMIVEGDDRLNWDIIWIGAAAFTTLLAGWLLVEAVRRGRTRGWSHAWRAWEPPA